MYVSIWAKAVAIATAFGFKCASLLSKALLEYPSFCAQLRLAILQGFLLDINV